MGWFSKGKKEQKLETPRSEGKTASLSETFPSIPGIDITKGIAMTGGTPESYRRVLSMFRKDAEERLQKFRFFLYEGLSGTSGKFPEKHLQSLITQIQALKSASATIGAAEISAEAAMLENAGKERDLIFIHDKLSNYIEHLSELVKNIRSVVETKQEENESSKPKSFMQRFSRQKSEKTVSGKTEPPEYLSVFRGLKEALKAQNIFDIENVLNELNKKQLDPKTMEVLEQISDQVLMTEFESAIRTIDVLISLNE